MFTTRKWLLAPALTLPLSLAACGGDAAVPPSAQDDAPTAGETALQDEPRTVTGCLRGGEEAGTFVVTADANSLTSLTARSATGELPTYTYVLDTGQDLSSMVGHQVAVTGTVEASDDFEHTRSRETEQPTTEGETVTPTVETERDFDLELRRLAVEDIRSVDDTCDTGTNR
ncbi:MAG: hypothetical protein AB7O67_08940 [Vicinamibacterales bacterium]